MNVSRKSIGVSAVRLAVSSLVVALSLSCGGPSAVEPSSFAAGEVDAARLDARSRLTDLVAHDGRGERIPPRFKAFAESFEAERQALGAPGAAVAIIERGCVTFAHGFGTKGVSSSEPVRATTLFRIGSMTKALTAAALLAAAADHRVGLDARLIDVVPDVALEAPWRAELTLRQLLTHQSGLVDAYSADGPHDDDALSAYSTSDAFRAAEYFMNPPGLFWNYSNPNFALAGLAAERLDGVPYREVMRRRVFRPLGMRRTFFLPEEVLADGDYARGKSTQPDGAAWDVGPDAYDNAWLRPAGYAYSSVLDYARFVVFLHSGDRRVLSPRLRREMQREQVNLGTAWDEYWYGLGVFVDRGLIFGEGYYPTPAVQHGGDINGYAANFYLLPETGFGIVTLASADGAHFVSSVVMALQRFGGMAPATAWPPSVLPDPSAFPPLAGTYVDPHLLGPVVVSEAGGVVSISIPYADAHGIAYQPALVPFSRDNFLLVFPEFGTLVVTFVPDQDGTPRWLRTRIAVAERQAGPATAVAPVRAVAPGALTGPGSPAASDAEALRERIRAAAREAPRLR